MSAVLGETTLADQEGRFRLPRPSLLGSLLHGPNLFAAKPGSSTRFELTHPDWHPNLWMAPLPKGHEIVTPGFVFINSGDGTVRSVWTLDPGVEPDAVTADVLFFANTETDSVLYVRCFDKGGAIYIPGKGFPVGSHPAALYCVASLDGYARQVGIRLSDSPGTCFFRTRDGLRFAKMDLDPGMVAWATRQPGTVALPQNIWYNPSGERTLCCEDFRH